MLAYASRAHSLATSLIACRLAFGLPPQTSFADELIACRLTNRLPAHNGGSAVRLRQVSIAGQFIFFPNMPFPTPAGGGRRVSVSVRPPWEWIIWAVPVQVSCPCSVFLFSRALDSLICGPA
jgi:hypothetical protein